MGTSRFDTSQRSLAVLLVEAGWSVTSVCRVYGITRMTFYRWKADSAAHVPEAAGLSTHAPEVAGLVAALKAGQRTEAQLRSALAALGDRVRGRRPARTRERRAEEDRALSEYMVELGKRYPSLSYRQMHRLLVDEGHPVGPMRVYRLYKEAGLALRRHRSPARRTGRVGKPTPATRPGEVWELAVGRTTGPAGNARTVWRLSDAFTDETLHVAYGWRPLAVSKILGELVDRHGAPQALHTSGEGIDLRSVERRASNLYIKVHHVSGLADPSA